MKKLLFFVAAMLVLASPAANAQKVNTAAELKKLEKADAAIADAKKGAKAATWVAHAKAYTDAFMAPTKDLGRGLPAQAVQMNAGQPEGMVEAELAGIPMVVFQYEYVDVYFNAATGMVEAWNQKKAVKEGMPEDESKDGESQVQKLLEKYSKLVDAAFEKKEKEIMTV